MKQKQNTKKYLLFCLVFLGITMFALPALALEIQWPPSPSGKVLTDNTNLTEMVEYFYEWGILLGGLAAFASLVFAGFQYITSVGDPVKMKSAREQIGAAIGGLVLLLSSYIILNTINPSLTNLKIPKVEPPSSNTEPINPGPPPNINQDCDKVIFYKDTRYKGLTFSIDLGEHKMPLLWQPKSLRLVIEDPDVDEICTSDEDCQSKIEQNYEDKDGRNYVCDEEGKCRLHGGICAVEFWDTECDKKDSSPMGTVYNDISNINSLYLTDDIKCISIKSAF